MRSIHIRSRYGITRVYICDDEGVLHCETITNEPVPEPESLIYAKHTWDQVLSMDWIWSCE